MTPERHATGPLPLADDDLATCVACGLCLPACPTWRVTGAEAASPRGRIAAMRAVQWDGAEMGGSFARMMEECVQCRGCEPVCPAFVPFGRLMEGAREALVETRRAPRLRRVAERLALATLVRRRLLRVATLVLYVLQRVRLVPRRLGIPRLAARDLVGRIGGRAGAGEAVVLFTGCVMDAWMRGTHRSAERVIEAAGGRVLAVPSGWDCCGALHAHAGRRDDARALARRVVASAPDGVTVLVDSAGCGAAMKGYGELVGSDEARAFAARVQDVHEWLAAREIRGLRPQGTPVVVQDPCHLTHVQRAEGNVHDVLARAYTVLQTDDAGLCCGAGGAYAALQPDLAGAIRDRKIAALRRVGGESPKVASANPGCVMHLAAGGVDITHPLDLLAAALEASP